MNCNDVIICNNMQNFEIQKYIENHSNKSRDFRICIEINKICNEMGVKCHETNKICIEI